MDALLSRLSSAGTSQNELLPKTRPSPHGSITKRLNAIPVPNASPYLRIWIVECPEATALGLRAANFVQKDRRWMFRDRDLGGVLVTLLVYVGMSHLK